MHITIATLCRRGDAPSGYLAASQDFQIPPTNTLGAP